MAYSFSLGDVDNLASYRSGLDSQLKWQPIFVLPGWLKAWWRVFGLKASLFLGLIKYDDAVIGIAPLKVEGGRASFIGDARVCDYLDFVISPGREADFFNTLLAEMKDRGLNRLELAALRPESAVLNHLVGLAGERHYAVSCRVEATSMELDLPGTWHEYLAALTAKQRHEVRRKLRRLEEEAGTVNFRVSRHSQDVSGDLAIFIKLFRQSRRDKAQFMDARMKTFFELMAGAMTEAGLLRFGFLELDSVPVAAVMYFDYNNNVYLYNSGYNPRYRGLSVGLLSKVLCIKDSIEKGRSKFDFLRGAEAYKYRLGGREVPLYECRVNLS